jgi:hypothetical protein
MDEVRTGGLGHYSDYVNEHFPGLLVDRKESLADYVRTRPNGAMALTEKAQAAGYEGIKAGDETVIFDAKNINAAPKEPTIDDFVKSRAKYYHGGNIEGGLRDTSDSKYEAFYVSDNQDYAASYKGADGDVTRVGIDPSAKLANLGNDPKLRSSVIDAINGTPTGEMELITKPDGSTLEVPKIPNDAVDFHPYTRAQVIQGIKDGKANFEELPEIKKILAGMDYDGQITNEVDYAQNIGIWNIEKVQTEQQLRTIWKAAPKEPVDVSPLIQEAKKYKDSAEEFKALGFDEILKDLKGVQRDSIVTIPTEKVEIKWHDDYDHALDTAKKNYDPDTAPPVDFIYDFKKDKYILDDGHNRYVSAQRNNQPIKGTVQQIQGNMDELADLYAKEKGTSITDIWNEAHGSGVGESPNKYNADLEVPGAPTLKGSEITATVRSYSEVMEEFDAEEQIWKDFETCMVGLADGK